ncbi:MAG: hypothetical protein DRN04_16460, partial [Thermoprotei archaeon]
PIHPYAVWKYLKEGYGVDISVKTVYLHVRKLEEMGLVERVAVDSSGRLRVMYAATDMGYELLQHTYQG